MTGANHPHMTSAFLPAIAKRVAALDWQRLATDLDAHGCAVVLVLLSPLECVALAKTYTSDEVGSFGHGDGVIFPVHQRPMQGKRGTHRVTLRHGMSRVRSGRRQTFGIIFHDAQSVSPVVWPLVTRWVAYPGMMAMWSCSRRERLFCGDMCSSPGGSGAAICQGNGHHGRFAPPPGGCNLDPM